MVTRYLLCFLVACAILSHDTTTIAQDSPAASATASITTPDGFEGNPTLDRALRRAFWKQRVPLMQRIKIRRALRDPVIREELEYSLTAKLLELAPPQAMEGKVNSQGIYVGDWIDIIQLIFDNWDKILELIMTIIDLFTDQQVALFIPSNAIESSVVTHATPVLEVPVLGLAV